jgi:hypothetical protein
MVKRSVLAVLFVLALTTPMFAQQGATVSLRSGEQISGELIDYNASGFVMNIGGQTRNIPAGEVGRIEFSGARALTADQQARLNAGQQFAVLNDGQTIEGRLFDIGGTVPLRLTFDTSSGRREINGNEVATIYLANTPTGTTGTLPSQTPGAVVATITVPANQQWTGSNLNVQAGETLYFQSSGAIQFSRDSNDRAEVAGSLAQKRPSGNAPLSSAYTGALLGRINNGPAFGIGNLSSVVMPGTGRLFLGVNDDDLRDNSGQFQVVISR